MSDEANDQAKRLASEIRKATESTEFDLAGYGAEGCAKLAQALEQPLSLHDMIRLSFVVGGGKKVRQKYNDGLPMLLAEALRKVGYSEDRGAYESFECAGLFKFQHNTDTDLKVTHVFPKLDRGAAAAEAERARPPVDDPLSPEELLVHADQRMFGKMVDTKCPSLAQRRRVLDVLKAARAEIAACEAKMTNLEALTSQEQARYDTLDATLLEEKQAWLGQQMQHMVDTGQLTAAEKRSVEAQLSEKLEKLEEQIATAESEGKTKRAEKLRSMLEEMQARSTALSECKPIVRKAKFEQEIRAVTKRLEDLAKLESSKAVLSMTEVQKLNVRPKLLEDLAAMQSESRGWFADA